MAHEEDDNRPVHRRRRTADADEPGDPAAPTGSRGSGAHAAAEDSRGRTLCIAVDDFGLHAGINQAALRLAGMGRVQAIGCMVGAPAWAAWSRLLRRLEPRRVDLGLHLDLTESPLLTRTGRPVSAVIRDTFLHRLDPQAVRAEIRAQLDAFEQAIGRGPAYIDGHQHVHQFPVVRDELLAELGGRYGAFKPWLRSTRRPARSESVPSGGWRSLAKPWIIEQLGAARLTSMARRLGYPQNRHLLGVYDFQGGTGRYRPLMAAWLRAAGNADLLMCHASVPAPGSDPLIEARHSEFLVLSSPWFALRLHEERIELRSMSHILQSGMAPGMPPAA